MKLSATEIEKELEQLIKNFDGKATTLMTLCGAFNLINHQQEEIKRLENLFETEHLMITELNKAFDNIKSEAYKEFVTKAEKKAQNAQTWTGIEPVVTVSDLNNILKEMG